MSLFNSAGNTIAVQGIPPNPSPHITPKIFIDIDVFPNSIPNKTEKPINGNNIANINTPNYKRKYVKFEETLNNVNKTGKIEVKTDTSGAVRTDGNNVDLESEKVNQAANTLMYNGLISLTNSKLSMAKSVITGR